MKVAKKIFSAIGTGIVISLSFVASVSAHIVVTPSEVLTGSYQAFSLSAPNEKDMAYTTIKLTVPAGLTNVLPTVKPGWVITTEKVGTGESATVSSIAWSGGATPGGQRDDFGFSAKVPAKLTELEWKAYQTYEDGTVVSWDQKEVVGAKDDDSAANGPLSVTKVVDTTADELASKATKNQAKSAKSTAQFAFYTAIAALIIGIVLIGTMMKPKE